MFSSLTMKRGAFLITAGACSSFVGYQYLRTPPLKTCTSSLYLAIVNNQPDAIKANLEKYPAGINEIHEIGMWGAEANTLDVAFHNRSLDAAQVLVENGAKIEDLRIYKHPLMIAAMHGHTGLIKALQTRKPNIINDVDEAGNTALFYVNKSWKSIPTISLLMGLGVDPKQQNHAGKTFYTELEENGLGSMANVLQAYEKVSGAKAKLKSY